MDSLLRTLDSLGLLKAVAPPRPECSLAELCDIGALAGGLSAGAGVRPDELLGPLLHSIGGSALRAKVTDVREQRQLTLVLDLEGETLSWRTPTLLALARAANRTFAKDPAARQVLELGEWEHRLQLWCVPKSALRALRPYITARSE